MARPQHGTPACGRTDPPARRSALWLPIFDELADPEAGATRWMTEFAPEAVSLDRCVACSATVRRRPDAPASGGQRRAAGEHRIRHADLFDAEVRPHNERFRAAAGVRPRDRVLDVGCGTGQSTRDAARAAFMGSVLGVDLSAAALELARRVSEDEGLVNVGVLFDLACLDHHRHPAGPGELSPLTSTAGPGPGPGPGVRWRRRGRARC